MDTRTRPVETADAEACGRIWYEAFAEVAQRHGFPPDLPSADVGVEFVNAFLENPRIFGVVAEREGEVVGSAFLTEVNEIRGVGPVSVAPAHQGEGIGRRLTEAVLERAQGAPGVRLVQDASNPVSLCLYASLGFDVREPLVLLEGRLEGGPLGPEVEVRPLEEGDLEACSALCRKAHGFDRVNELRAPPPFSQPFVALRGGRLTAYAAAPGFWPTNHAVAETEADLRALLAGSSAALGTPLSFLLPVRQGSLFRWCLDQGMRATKTGTLMTLGRYQEPRGSYLPSVWY